MSNNITPLKAVFVRDPLLDATHDKKAFAVLRSGSYIQYNKIPVQGANASSWTQSFPPPSEYVYTDRCVLFEQDLELVFTGTTSGPGQTLLNLGQYDAFRQFPLASVCQNLTVQINQSTVSIPLNRVVGAMQRLNNDVTLREREYSTSAIGQSDGSQSYDDLVMSSRNPLSSYSDSIENSDCGRGGHRVEVLSNTSTSAVIRARITEPLYISPLFWGRQEDDSNAFYGVKTFTVTWGWANGNLLSRIWSHSDAGGSTISNLQVNFLNTSLCFKYITPSPLDRPALNITSQYPYNSVMEYNNLSGIVVPPNNITQVQSSNITLDTLPSKIIVSVLPKQFSNLTYTDPDCAMSIESCSVRYMGVDGMLSGASPEQLYYMSLRNGLQMSYREWSGGPVTTNQGSVIKKFGTVGSYLVINPALDLATVDVTSATGQNYNVQLQITLTVRNVNQNVNANPYVSVIVVSSGVFNNLHNGQSILNMGVMSPKDVIDSKSIDLPISTLLNSEAGGDFWGDSKRQFSKIWSGIKNVAEEVGPVVSTVAALAPILGAGEGVYTGGAKGKKKGKGRGLVDLGGRVISKNQMMKRIM